MKKNQDIMHVIERYNRYGELSFELHASGKDPITRKNKVFVRTFKVPFELYGKKKEIATFRLQVQLKFKEEVKQLSTGQIVKPTKMLFSDFANICAEGILNKNAQSYNYYRKFKDQLGAINAKLGNFYLHELTQQIVDDFLFYLCTRTYTKQTVTVKDSLRPLIKAQNLKFKAVAKSLGLSDTTLLIALTKGKKVHLTTATSLCQFLSVKVEHYFEIKTEEIQYAKSANQSTRTVLHYVLKRAANKGYIPRNFASNDYAENVTGRPKNKKTIYDTKESILEFAQCIDKEQNPEIKIACALYLHLGLRGCEAAGLEWRDFTFNTPTNSEVYINRNSIYVSGFGIRTKDTKTTTSERTIVITEKLYYLLLEYKKWWDIQKEQRGDLWANSDRLFLTNKGKNRSGQTLAEWVSSFEAKNSLLHVPPHSLRTTNITLQGLLNAPKKAVQNRAGHAHYSTTADIYDLGTKAANQEAANLLNVFFANEN